MARDQPKPDREEFYRRIEEPGVRPYSVGRQMGAKASTVSGWMKRRPVPTKVQVTVTPPRPTAAQPAAEQIEPRAQPVVPALTEDECVDLYKFIWGREGLIADGLLDIPEAGRNDARCEAQGKRLFAIAVKYGWDREQLLGFIGIAVFTVGVGQDSWMMYRAWNQREKEKKKTEKPKPSPLAAPEISIPKETEALIEKRMGAPPKV